MADTDVPVFGNLDTRHEGKRRKLLLAPFSCQDAVYGPVTAPANFVTDFASIKTLRDIGFFIIFALLAGYGDKAATIHDYLYNGGLPDSGATISREDADGIYFRALRKEGVARWRAFLFYSGVRLFGGARWKGKRK
jgi:hypothetical protein